MIRCTLMVFYILSYTLSTVKALNNGVAQGNKHLSKFEFRIQEGARDVMQCLKKDFSALQI
jgi:hypothetical protein